MHRTIASSTYVFISAHICKYQETIDPSGNVEKSDKRKIFFQFFFIIVYSIKSKKWRKHFTIFNLMICQLNFNIFRILDSFIYRNFIRRCFIKKQTFSSEYLIHVERNRWPHRPPNNKIILMRESHEQRRKKEERK